jgi:four helix bundle protein
MSTLREFEQIEAWQKAHTLTPAVYRLSKEGRFSRDFALRDDVRRTAVSVMNNIAEGFERGSTAEFLQFLRYAEASAGELKSQLYVALDEGYLSPVDFEAVAQQIEGTKGLIAGFSKYLRAYRSANE